MEFAKKSPLNEEYKGPVTTKQVAEGILIAIKNAKSLLEDARLLLTNRRFPRTVSLSILAMEEIGKVEKLKSLLLDDQKVATSWKSFRNHREKNFVWQFPILKMMKIADEPVLRELLSSKSESSEYIDHLKQVGFYSAAVRGIGKNSIKWLDPDVFIDEPSARFYFQLAEIIVSDDAILWTEGALDIYKKYYEVGRKIKVWNVHEEFYKELQSEGFITEDRLSRILANLRAAANNRILKGF